MGRRVKIENLSCAIDAYKAGESLTRVSKNFKCCRSTLRDRIKEKGLRITPHHRNSIRTGPKNNMWADGRRYHQPAVAAVGRAIKSGILQRPTECSRCGSQVPLHAHHDDYNKPLDVRWLCFKCHYAWHRENIAVPILFSKPKSPRKKWNIVTDSHRDTINFYSNHDCRCVDCKRSWADYKAKTKLTRRVMDTAKWICALCGGKAKQCDHIIPRAIGGHHRVDNLRALCLPCHREETRRFMAQGDTFVARISKPQVVA